jgi:hypothetical protein
MKRARSALALGLCALIAACDADTTARTQVMVVVDAQSQVRTRATDVDFEVRSGVGPVDDWDVRLLQSITPGDTLSWPLEVALVPRDGDADRVFLAIATARDADGEAVAQVRAISGYQAGKTLSLLLLFENACIDKADLCNEEQTCRRGECVDAHVEPGQLPGYERDDGGNPVLIPFWDAGAADGGPGGSGTGGSGSGGSGGSGGSADAGPDAGGGACSEHADCDDDDPCNGEERCVEGACEDGEEFECPEVDQPCLRNVCVDDDGEPSCETRDADEGETCQDADESDEEEESCARDYECVAGVCEPQTVDECDPGQCNTSEGCHPEDGCVYEPRSSSTECDDGEACTQDDTCDGDGECEGEAYSVDCTVDVCDGAGGCTNDASDALCSGPCKTGTCDATMDCLNVTFSQDFTDCSDGDSDTGSDLCYRGECVGGSEGAPSGSCAVEGCGCSSFSNVKDLVYHSSSTSYVGLIDASQNGEAPCHSGTVSLVLDVTQDQLTPYATDTENGAISEIGYDLNLPYVVANAHVGLVNPTMQTVDWLNTAVDAARAGHTLGSLRGIAQHTTGSIFSSQYQHVWLCGSNTGVSGASRVLRCTSCSSNEVMGCSGGTALTCVDGYGLPSSSVAAVLPYTYFMTLSTVYGGAIQLFNFGSAPRRAVYEDQTGKDLYVSSLEISDTDGAWSGALKTSVTGQVLLFGSGTANNLRMCNDASNSGNAACTAITGLPNQSVRAYTRAVMGSNNTAMFMLANTGTSYYLLVLPVGLDPTVGSNWREILLANSGTTANALAAGPSGFMVLGKSGSVPYVWSWNP